MIKAFLLTILFLSGTCFLSFLLTLVFGYQLYERIKYHGHFKASNEFVLSKAFASDNQLQPIDEIKHDTHSGSRNDTVNTYLRFSQREGDYGVIVRTFDSDTSVIIVDYEIKKLLSDVR